MSPLPLENQSARLTASQNDRSAEILAAATNVFAQQGYRNTDVQLIADAIGVGKGTIYRHFPTKRELFLAAADRGMRMLHEAVESAISGHKDPLDQIRAAIRAYLDFFSGHPEFVELLIQERADFRDRATPTYFVHRQANLARWQQTYGALIDAGRVRNISVEQITEVMSGLVYGTMFISFFTGRHASPDEQADHILDVVFNGILTPREQSKRQSIGSNNESH